MGLIEKDINQVFSMTKLRKSKSIPPRVGMKEVGAVGRAGRDDGNLQHLRFQHSILISEKRQSSLTYLPTRIKDEMARGVFPELLMLRLKRV